jgi:hypothetical protein
MRRLFLIPFALLGMALVGAAPPVPTLRFDADAGVVRLEGFPAAPAANADSLTVRIAVDPAAADLPAVDGSLAFDDGALVFRPRFGFDPGVRYRATAPSVAGSLDFGLPNPERSPSTVVEAVYPKAQTLPENHLRFYLHFSAPMSRGFATKHVRLLDEEGQSLDAPFLDLAEELWNRDGTRLTLLLDPGRVKSGLVPHEEDGPVLLQGKSYTLLIDTGFEDAEGKPLREEFRRGFTVGAPDTEQPTVEKWNIIGPAAGTREPLVVQFGQLLDHAMILRMIEIETSIESPVAGEMAVPNTETSCAFTPDTPWKAGSYRLRVNRLLEDPSGNSIARPFERQAETFAPRSSRTHAFVEFAIREETTGKE